MPKSPPLQDPSALAELPVPPGRKASEYLTAYKGIAYSAIRAISQDVASINLKLYKRKMVRGKPEFDEVLEHESLSLLHEVNSFSTFYDLMEATQVFLEAAGEAFWLFLKSNGMPTEIWPLRPDWVTILPSRKDIIKAYRFRPGGIAEYIDFEPEDVIHFKNFNPVKMTRGKGTIQASAMELDLDDYAAKYSRNFFFNSAVPSILFKWKDGRIKQEQMDRFIQNFRSKFGGVENTHKVGAVSGDVEVEHLSKDAKDVGLIDQRKYARDQVLSIFQVPKSVLGITEDVNRANAEATIRAYMERVIDPRMKKFVSHLNEFYLPRFWSKEDLFFDYETPVPENEDLKLKIYENGLTNGWLTINEVREEENLPPVDGGDSIYLPLQLQPIGSAKKSLKALLSGSKAVKFDVQKVEAKPSFNISIPPRRLREIRKETLKKKIRPQVVKMLSRVIELSEDQNKKEAMWKKLIAKTDVWEEVYSEKVSKLFSEQEAIVNANIEEERKGVIQEVIKLLFDKEKEDEKWKNTLEPQTKIMIKEQGRDTLDFLGQGGEDIDMSEARVVRFIEKEAGGMIEGINKTTLQKLRTSLVEGVKAGEGIPELKARVADIYDAARGKRAEKIARTEVLRATNFATQEAYRQSGVVEGKEWLTALDDRVCPICDPLDGKIVGLKKSFETSVGSVDYPPAHPACRCTTIPVLAERAKEEKEIEKEEMEEEREELVKKAKEEAEAEGEKILAEAKKKAVKIKKTAREKAEAEAKKEKKTLISELKDLRDRAVNALKENG